MFHTSYIELSESAIKNNIEFIQNYIGKDVIFSSVVKGNSYGHGIQHYCPIAHKYGVRHFSVFSVGEALYVTKALENLEFTVMIMGQIENNELSWQLKTMLSFTFSNKIVWMLPFLLQKN